jgi:chitinase
MVGIEMVWPHDNFSDDRWVVVGVTAGEVSRASIFHNDPAEVENDCICLLLAHGVDSCQVLASGTNWSAGLAQVGFTFA